MMAAPRITLAEDHLLDLSDDIDIPATIQALYYDLQHFKEYKYVSYVLTRLCANDWTDAILCISNLNDPRDFSAYLVEGTMVDDMQVINDKEMHVQIY